MEFFEGCQSALCPAVCLQRGVYTKVFTPWNDRIQKEAYHEVRHDHSFRSVSTICDMRITKSICRFGFQFDQSRCILLELTMQRKHQNRKWVLPVCLLPQTLNRASATPRISIQSPLYRTPKCSSHSLLTIFYALSQIAAHVLTCLFRLSSRIVAYVHQVFGQRCLAALPSSTCSAAARCSSSYLDLASKWR